MKRKLSLLLSLALLLSFGLAGSALAQPVELEIWSPLSGSKATTFDALVEAYNASQSDVHVKHVSQGSYSVMRQKMAGAFNAKNMPPLVVVDYIEVPLYAQRNMLIDMSTVLDQDVLNDFFPGMMVDLVVDGTTYAIPYNRTTQGFIVNNELLEKAGISRVAATWDEFYEDAVKFRDAMGEDYYYGFAYFNQYIYDAIAYTWNVDMASAEGQVNLNTDSMKSMFSFFRKMYEENLLAMVPTTSGSFAEQYSPFLESKVATVFQSSSFIPSALSMFDFDWSFNYMPNGEGGHAVTIGGTNIGVTAAATQQQREAAAKFLEYIASPESGAKVFIETSNLPVRRSTLDLDSVKAFTAENSWTQNLLSQIDYAKPASVITRNVGDVYNLVNDMILRIIYNGEDIQEVLDEFTDTFQSAIDAAKDMGEFIQ